MDWLLEIVTPQQSRNALKNMRIVQLLVLLWILFLGVLFVGINKWYSLAEFSAAVIYTMTIIKTNSKR
jgi:hypothetical protein